MFAHGKETSADHHLKRRIGRLSHTTLPIPARHRRLALPRGFRYPISYISFLHKSEQLA